MFSLSINLSLSIILQLAASLLTAAGIYKMGDRNISGPLLGVISQIPWWWFMALEGLWGLLPLNILMLCIHVRNLYKWSKENETEVQLR